MGLEDLAQFKKTQAPIAKEAPKPNKEKSKRPNIGWLFYNDYFKDLDYDCLESEANKNIIKDKVETILRQSFVKPVYASIAKSSFDLQTTYPGLVLGSGNTHELPSIEGQAILGFHFDYTSGLPEISGPSIKGILKSAFTCKEYIQELLESKTLDVEALKQEIFDNNDTFFDAFIVKSGKENKILGDDYITPHKEPTKNPVPLRFIKVLPEVTFRFGFDLSDGRISKEEKLALFKQIILDFGLGAKTNVGYGKFTEA